VGNPSGVLFLPSQRLVVVTSQSGEGAIYFFNYDDYKNTTLQTSDAIGKSDLATLDAFDPRSAAPGEHEDEIFTTTQGGLVIRSCIPRTSCAAQRNAVMLKGGKDLRGIETIKSRNVYLVVERELERVFECPVAQTNIYLESCSVFAFRPEGVPWGPYAINIDVAKSLVYVADYNKSIILTFTVTGEFMGRLAQQMTFLSKPTALAIRPGPLAPLSRVCPPATSTAGVPIDLPLTLLTSSNAPLSASYPISAELFRYQIVATGVRRDGSSTTLHGTVPTAALAELLIKYAGVWDVGITEGLTNPVHLGGSPFKITISPDVTNATFCTSSFSSRVTAGGLFRAELLAFDRFNNPTEHRGDEFYGVVDGARLELTRANTTGQFSVSRTVTVAGTHFMSVYHSNTDEKGVHEVTGE